jgi:hypothetical protein
MGVRGCCTARLCHSGCMLEQALRYACMLARLPSYRWVRARVLRYVCMLIRLPSYGWVRARVLSHVCMFTRLPSYGCTLADPSDSGQYARGRPRVPLGNMAAWPRGHLAACLSVYDRTSARQRTPRGPRKCLFVRVTRVCVRSHGCPATKVQVQGYHGC